MRQITVCAQYAAFPYDVRRYHFDIRDVDIAGAVYLALKAEQEREGYSRVWYYPHKNTWNKVSQ